MYIYKKKYLTHNKINIFGGKTLKKSPKKLSDQIIIIPNVKYLCRTQCIDIVCNHKLFFVRIS